MVTPTNDEDRLIDQALSLLRNAMAETKTVLPAVQFRPADSKAVRPSETPVEEERAASLQMPPMVANIAVSEAPSPSLLQPDTEQVSKDMLPTVQRPVAKQTSKGEPPAAPPVQEEQKASLIDQALSMVAVTVSEPTTVTEASQQPIAKQTSKDVVPTEPPVQEERTASLIARAMSMVESVAAAEPKLVEAPSSLQKPVPKTSRDVLSTKPRVQGTVSLIGQTLSMVAVAVSESTVAEAPSASLKQPVAQDTSIEEAPTEPRVQKEGAASLIDQTLSMVEQALQRPVAKQISKGEPPTESLVQEQQTVSLIDLPKPLEVTTPSSQQPVVKQPTPKERLDIERAEIRKRVETFGANQQRFQREREEYYAATMAKVRATRKGASTANPMGTD